MAEFNGVPIYPWDPWPEPLVTKSQLSKAGYQPGPLRAVVRYSKSSTGDGFLHLFSPDEGIRRKPPTEKQLAAQAKRKAGELNARTCTRCGAVQYFKRDLSGGLCECCWLEVKTADDRHAAAEWAKRVLADGCVILDMETTGLYDAEPVEIAVLDHTGAVLFNSRVKPLRPGRIVEPDPDTGVAAVDIHGIRPEDLANAPTFGEIYPALYEALHGKHVVIYHKEFDLPILRATREEWECAAFEFEKASCAMRWFAQFCGDWSDYWRSYRWQSLPGGLHSALGDARATLVLLKEMVASLSE